MEFVGVIAYTATFKGSGEGTVNNEPKKKNADYAIAVLQLAQFHLPDSTLLAYAHADILERQDAMLKQAGQANMNMNAILENTGGGMVLLLS